MPTNCCSPQRKGTVDYIGMLYIFGSCVSACAHWCSLFCQPNIYRRWSLASRSMLPFPPRLSSPRFLVVCFIVYLFIYLFICLFVCFICLFVLLFVCLFVCLFTWLCPLFLTLSAMWRLFLFCEDRSERDNFWFNWTFLLLSWNGLLWIVF
jgi:hypothetical protein